MKILTSLAENDYFLGLAALINSVVKHGTYVDKIVIGYRDDLPKWLPTLHDSKNGQSCTLRSGVEIEFVKLEGNLHMVHEKPKWFQYLTKVLEPDATEFFFFDSDIIIKRRMSFFGEWVKQGVALCEDVNFDMSVNHPIRKQWATLAKEEGLAVNKDLNRYFNSGFLGWTKETADFVDDWADCFTILAKKSGDMKKFRVTDRTSVVLSANQDSLNLASMITEVPLSTMGAETMGFRSGVSLMEHPIGAKPWNRKFVKESISGRPPRSGDTLFWQNVNGSELNPVPPFKAKYKIILCNLLKGLGRFYKSPQG